MQGEAKGSLTYHVNSIKIHQQVKSEATQTKKQEEFTDNLPF